jgi:putative intracellular protease/amidase
VVEDRELITGQNPASALEVGKRLVERLKIESNSALDSSRHQK